MSTATIDHVIGTDGLFLLHFRGGSARLRGVDGDVVRITDRDGAELEDEFEIERGDGSLSVRLRKGLQIRLGRVHHSGSPDLEIEVPRRATVVVETTRGELTGEDLAGSQRYQTVSGDVKLRRVAGSLAVEAVSGDVAVAAAGELRLELRTASGDVEIRAGRIAGTAVTTTSGDIAIAGEFLPDASHRIETVSGDTLLAAAGGTRIELSTLTGDIAADVPHRSEGGRGRKVVVVGNGRATVAAHSMSGDIHIVAPRHIDTVPIGQPGEPPAADPSPMPAPEFVAAASPAPQDRSDAAIAAAYDAARLRVLQTLERGEIDIAEATRRLEALDTADVPGVPIDD